MSHAKKQTQIAALTAACLAGCLASCLPRGEEARFSDSMSPRPRAAAFGWAGDFSQGLAPVLVGKGRGTGGRDAGAYGFLDTTGRVAIAPAFAAAGAFSGNRAPVLKDGRWGYIDVTGRMVIPAVYDWAGPFREGFAPVSSGSGFRYIDTTGSPLGAEEYAEARAFSQGLAAVKFGTEDSGAWGFIDARGEMAIPPLFAGVPGGFREGLAAVQVDLDAPARMGFVDTSGGFALDTLFDAAGDFSEGLAPVGRALRGRGGAGGFEGVWGYVDTAGRLAIEPRFAWAGGFQGGRALVMLPGGNYAFIARDGAVAQPLPDSVVPVPPFSGDRVAFRLRKRYGYLDSAGAQAVAPRFREAGPFREGWARARLDGPSAGFWVYVDRSGKYLSGNTGVTVATPFPKSR